jgi:alkanesulfonate monooxygenase SsuD/methylene tetrahydromethanopterin reductase-like flavin-dependent oxidoreductase (luciferase family)
MATIDQIGLSLWTMQSTAAHPGLWRALYRRLGEDAQLAEELGFHAVWLGEHRSLVRPRVQLHRLTPGLEESGTRSGRGSAAGVEPRIVDCR